MGKHCEECGDHPAEYIDALGVWLCEECAKREEVTDEP
jgi:ribosomal protein L37AE/L43A